MKSFIRVSLLIDVAMLCVVSNGCGSKIKTVEIEGTVTYDGKPVPMTDVNFVSEEGNRGASGLTNMDGHFRLHFTRSVKGVPTGSYKVTLTSQGDQAPCEERDSLPDFDKLLERYSEANTPLKKEITKTDKEMKIEVSLD